MVIHLHVIQLRGLYCKAYDAIYTIINTKFVIQAFILESRLDSLSKTVGMTVVDDVMHFETTHGKSMIIRRDCRYEIIQFHMKIMKKMKIIILRPRKYLLSEQGLHMEQ